MASIQSVRVFAYGSNMLTRRLRERTPSATPVAVGRLDGHTLRWHKRGRMDGSGKCDAMASGDASDCIHGVVFELDAAEKAALDRAEGLGRGYDEKTVEIVAAGARVPATLYYATDVDASLRPYDWYKALVVAGARERGLPADYIAALEAVRSIADPDRRRESKHLALLAGG
jgi:gamma-glutamylcyclotransferase